MIVREGLEFGDLKRLVHSELHIDEFKSKLGDDADVVVVSLKVAGKEPATDLVNFIEKGYNFVLDADVSAGEMDDGDYIVFVEMERNSAAPTNIIHMLDDVTNLTGFKTSQWRVRYYKGTDDHDLSPETLKSIMPLDPAAYRKKFNIKDEKFDDKLEAMKATAGVKTDKKAPKNDLTDSIRRAAGLL